MTTDGTYFSLSNARRSANLLAGPSLLFEATISVRGHWWPAFDPGQDRHPHLPPGGPGVGLRRFFCSSAKKLANAPSTRPIEQTNSCRMSTAPDDNGPQGGHREAALPGRGWHKPTMWPEYTSLIAHRYSLPPRRSHAWRVRKSQPVQPVRGEVAPHPVIVNQRQSPAYLARLLCLTNARHWPVSRQIRQAGRPGHRPPAARASSTRNRGPNVGRHGTYWTRRWPDRWRTWPTLPSSATPAAITRHGHPFGQAQG